VLGNARSITHNERRLAGLKGHFRVIANRQMGWLALFAFGASACIGGQSGTEGQPDLPACANPFPVAQSAGLDEATPLGTPRVLFDALAAPQVADLRWFSHDASSSFSDTTVSLSVVGTPQTATYVASDSACSARVLVTGGTLRFQTADGAFNESFPGTASFSAGGPSFAGTLSVGQFTGSYDIAAIASGQRNPLLTLHTNLSPARGSLSLSGDSPPGASAASADIAEWPGASRGSP
jgi:hypothetical protein